VRARTDWKPHGLPTSTSISAKRNDFSFVRANPYQEWRFHERVQAVDRVTHADFSFGAFAKWRCKAARRTRVVHRSPSAGSRGPGGTGHPDHAEITACSPRPSPATTTVHAANVPTEFACRLAEPRRRSPQSLRSPPHRASAELAAHRRRRQPSP
jgi:hypothetical protein